MQIRHILVGTLTQSSPGKAAAILESPNPAEALREHETAGIDGGISALESIDTDTAEVLNMHAQLMEQLQIQAHLVPFILTPKTNCKFSVVHR